MTNNIKQERRYRRTEALILNGLTTLLQQKSIKEITVRELADLVDINRSTFYLHYTDIYDLLEKTEQRLLQQLSTKTGRCRKRRRTSSPFWNRRSTSSRRMPSSVRRSSDRTATSPFCGTSRR